MKRIVMTGGSGKAGKYVVRHLLDHGYQVLNLDSQKLDEPRARTDITDITDSGQVFNALSSYTGTHEFDPDQRPVRPDAVVHFAAIPRILLRPDNELFRINTMGTYNVIEAAVKLGIPKVIIASSETIYGTTFAYEHRDPLYFPLDEEYPRAPSHSGTAPTSTPCGSATWSSRTSTSCSRAGSKIRASASALPGATSTPATWARSPGWPSRRTGWASKSSTR